MEIKTIELFGKPVFSMVSMSEPMKMATPMPDEEAGFVFVRKGGCINYTETDELRLMADQAVSAVRQ